MAGSGISCLTPGHSRRCTSKTLDTRTRRARGALLRVALRRTSALVAGLVLLLPAVVVALGDYRWESWVSDGLGLIAGGTGAALLFTGLAGRRPDWIDPDDSID
jgi:hypothetical protein